mgnify:FL=1
MSLVARLTRVLIATAAALPVPARGDTAAARVALRLIGVYQRHLSRHSGRLCLFHPTCSHRAAALLRDHGWRSGIPLIRAQLRRCDGNYTLLRTRDGGVELVTADGMRFAADEVAEWVRG